MTLARLGGSTEYDPDHQAQMEVMDIILSVLYNSSRVTALASQLKHTSEV